MTVCNLIIKEHSSSSYAPRTYVNAAAGDVTIALAVDHNTAGEKCTQKAVAAAKSWIFKLDPDKPFIENARAVYHFFKQHNVKVVNIAGNGIYTWDKKDWTQEQINLYLYNMLKLVHTHCPIEKVVSGGQTGTDIAGAVVAVKLGIDCELTYPKGFKMRFEDGKDVEMSEYFVRELINDYVEKL